MPGAADVVDAAAEAAALVPRSSTSRVLASCAASMAATASLVSAVSLLPDHVSTRPYAWG